MFNDKALVTFQGLSKDYGITYSRTSLARLERDEKFPKRFKPFKTRGSRFYYRRREIEAWLKGK
jgi:predicted DNA-binding transcriptional regulator AlpA